MSSSPYSLHVREREAGAAGRTLVVETFDGSPLPEGAQHEHQVNSTEEVRQIAASLGSDLSRVEFAGGDVEHEAAAP